MSTDAPRPGGQRGQRRGGHRPDPAGDEWVDHILDQLADGPLPEDPQPSGASEPLPPAAPPERPAPLPTETGAASTMLLDELMALSLDEAPAKTAPPQPEHAPPQTTPPPPAQASTPPPPRAPTPPLTPLPPPPPSSPELPSSPPLPPPLEAPSLPQSAPARSADPMLATRAPARRSPQQRGDPGPELYDHYEDGFDSEYDDPLDGDFDESLPEARSPWRTAAGWIATVALAVVLSLLIRSFVAHAFHVESGSMEPTLSPSDRILVNKLSGDPARGNLVVFSRSDGDLVKRVVALAGETIRFDQGQVQIGESWLQEPYLAAGTGTHVRAAIPNCVESPGDVTVDSCTVPDGHIFVLGDNREVSFDSRNFGPVPLDDVIGHAALQFWPLGDLRQL